MLIKYWIFIAIIMGIMPPAVSMADIVKLPDSDAEVVTLNSGPNRGMIKSQVEQRYGEPVRRLPAVGEPPISRWDYPDYSVYFESDRVLHAVAHQAQ